uniref:Bestrophin homolog n=1 Tax=Angiostrongylus cantonensis TaxID=6313 RepID=A0A0K0DI66_ANGCA
MTVNYMQAAATARVGTFLKLLFRWRGSVWKTIWKELAIFLFLYFNVRFVKDFFETIISVCFYSTLSLSLMEMVDSGPISKT